MKAANLLEQSESNVQDHIDLSRKHVVRCLVGAYCALSFAAFGHGLQRFNQFVVIPDALLDSMYGWWIAITLVLVLLEIGRFTIRLTSPQTELTAVETLLIRLCVGLSVGYIVLFSLGLAGLLKLSSILPLVTIAGLSFFHRVRNGNRESETISIPGSPAVIFPIYGLAAWFTPFLLLASLPNIDWDGALFHIPFAEQLPDRNFLETDPVFVAHNYPTAPHLYYAAMLLAGAESAIQPMNLIFAALIPVFVYVIGCRIEDERFGRLAAVLCLTINVIWEVAITPRIDCFLAFGFLAALWFLVVWLKNVRQSHLLPLLGLTLGLTLGLKFTATVFCMAIIPTVILFSIWHRETITGTRFGRCFLLAAVLTAVPSSFFYVRNLVSLGDPLYPLLRHIHIYDSASDVRSPLEPQLAEIEARHATLPAIDNSSSEDLNALPAFPDPEPARIRDSLLFDLPWAVRYPRMYARKPLHWIGPFVLLFFLWPLASRKPESIVLYVVTLGLYGVLASRTYITRLILPVLPIFAIGAAAVIRRADQWCASRTRVARGWVTGVTYAAAAIILLSVAFLEWDKLNGMRPLRYWNGTSSKAEWTAAVGYNGASGFSRFVQFWNDGVDSGRYSESSRVMMLGEGKAHLLQCDALRDMSWNALPWLVEIAKADGKTAAIATSMRKQKINYLLINISFLRLCYNGRMNHDQRRRLEWSFALLNRFLKEHATFEHSLRGVYLFRLHPERSSTVVGHSVTVPLD